MFAPAQKEKIACIATPITTSSATLASRNPPTPAAFTEMPKATKNAIFVMLSLQIAVIYTVMLMITRGVTAAELSIRTPAICTEMQTIITSVTIANCKAKYSDGVDNPMDGKKIIFIGNSYTYYGQTVLEKSQTKLTQKVRTGDKGYFYNLCRLNGADLEVTNWTFGGHNLEHLFGGNCTANRGCDGEDHKAYLVDPYFDYVVVQPGSGVESSARFLEDMEGIMNFFKAANPEVKFAVLVPYSAYGTIGSVIHLAKEFLDGLKAVDAMGVTVVDWGGLVMDILTGRVTVPNSTLSYTKNSFVICKSAKDGYHPNQLSGYITTLMTYCALTGTSAPGQDYAFCNDSSQRPANTSSKFYDFESFISTYYTYNNATTNYPEIFASDADMRGIQSLIDAHLAARAYLNYNYSAPEADGDGNTGDSSGGDTAEECVAKVASGGSCSGIYLDKDGSTSPKDDA